MEHAPFREQFAAELNRRRLPKKYIQRLLEELDDHLADLQERNPNMSTARKPDSDTAKPPSAEIMNFQAHLGDPAHLAAIAEKQYRNRSFLGRHPLLTFVVAPIPMLLVSWTATMMGALAIGILLNHIVAPDTGDPRAHPYAFNIGVFVFWSWLLGVLVPLVNTLFLCRMARRNAVPWTWAMTTISLIALMCASINIRVIQPINDHYVPDSLGNGSLVIGLGLPTSLAELLSWSIRFVAAVFIGLLLIKRAQRLQKLDEFPAHSVVSRQAA